MAEKSSSDSTGRATSSEAPLKVISLFSGAMGLDLGLEAAGLETAVCVEIDPKCSATIRRNRPELELIQADIASVSTAKILAAANLRPGQAFAVVGGPPCQSFSTGGLRQSIRDRRGDLFAEFLRVIDDARPSYFVFENVAHILTAAIRHRPIAERPGQRWHLSSYKRPAGQLALGFDDGTQPLADDEQAGSALAVILDAFEGLGYSLTFAVLNAADYGVPQRRLRFVLMGSRSGDRPMIPTRTNAADGSQGLPPWRTLRDAIGDLRESYPQHSNYTPEFQRFFELIPPGGNWRDLPVELQQKALGERAFAAGGGKTGFFRRLSWDEPAPTIVGKPNRKSHAICHPDEIRPLTVRESARVQGFPDEWEFDGSMHAQYLQIGNAVPVGLGQAIGKVLIDSYAHETRCLETDCEMFSIDDWQCRREAMLDQAHAVLRAAARNKVSQRSFATAV